MKKVAIWLRHLACWLCAHVLPGGWTLGVGWPWDLLSKWYHNNGYFRYPVGKEIRAGRRYLGYGIAARGIVIGHACLFSWPYDEVYIIDMFHVPCESFAELDAWTVKGQVPDRELVNKIRVHSKWNIENKFSVVPLQKQPRFWRRIGIATLSLISKISIGDLNSVFSAKALR